MGIFSCPQCNIEINTDDKGSFHQVNDLTQHTFCCCECSVNYTIKHAKSIIEDRYGPYPLTLDLIEEMTEDLSFEGIQGDSLSSLISQLQNQ